MKSDEKIKKNLPSISLRIFLASPKIYKQAYTQLKWTPSKYVK